VGSYYLPVLPYSEAAYLAAVGAGLGVLHDLNLAARGLAQLGDLGARLLRVRVRVKARVRVRVRVRVRANPNPNQRGGGMVRGGGMEGMLIRGVAR